MAFWVCSSVPSSAEEVDLPSQYRKKNVTCVCKTSHSHIYSPAIDGVDDVGHEVE
jgi:hypothetical protein